VSAEGRHLSLTGLEQYLRSGVPIEHPIDGDPRLTLIIDPSGPAIGLRAPRGPNEALPRVSLEHVNVHAGRDSGDGDDDFSLQMNVSGVSQVAGARGETMLRDGDAMLLSYSVSRTISRTDPVDHRVIRVPRAALAPLVRNIDDVVLRAIPRGTGMLSLLKGYVDAVFDDPAVGVPDMRRLVVAHLCDLVAVTLGATRDAGALAERRGVRAARLRAIKADIEAHLAHGGDLSPGAVAKRQQVSDSYIRKLFGGEGTSFSEYVLARRLLLAHRILTDRRWAGAGIASIAYDAGFGDLSYFNRAFRRCYGTTPSGVRDAIRSEQNSSERQPS